MKWMIRSVGIFDIASGAVLLGMLPFILLASGNPSAFSIHRIELLVMLAALGVWFLLAGGQVLRTVSRGSIQHACFVAGFVSVGYTNSFIGLIDSITCFAILEAFGHLTVFVLIVWVIFRIQRMAVRLLTPPPLNVIRNSGDRKTGKSRLAPFHFTLCAALILLLCAGCQTPRESHRPLGSDQNQRFERSVEAGGNLLYYALPFLIP